MKKKQLYKSLNLEETVQFLKKGYNKRKSEVLEPEFDDPKSQVEFMEVVTRMCNCAASTKSKVGCLTRIFTIKSDSSGEEVVAFDRAVSVVKGLHEITRLKSSTEVQSMITDLFRKSVDENNKNTTDNNTDIGQEPYSSVTRRARFNKNW